MRRHLPAIILLTVSTLVGLGAAELVLRLKNASMSNYDIEMWRYSKALKVRAADGSFDHVRSKSAVLEKVTIRLNEWGLRGPAVEPLPAGGRRILFLGGSITLGWGVPEDQTVEARLQAALAARGETAQVLNGGVGNYNAERYVTRFFNELTGLQPTDIVVHYFLRDAEDLPAGRSNVVLRNSQLAVTLWVAMHRVFDRSGTSTLVDHYRAAYEPDAPGFVGMQAQIKRLAEYARARGIRLYMAMTPDVHDLVHYQFGFVHERMQTIARANGYTFVDLFPAMKGRTPDQIWAMPGDPHPNGLGHGLMAEAILPVVAIGSPAANAIGPPTAK